MNRKDCYGKQYPIERLFHQYGVYLRTTCNEYLIWLTQRKRHSFCCYYLLVIVSELLPPSDIKTLLKSTEVFLSLSKNTISIRSVMSSVHLLLLLLNTVVQYSCCNSLLIRNDQLGIPLTDSMSAGFTIGLKKKDDRRERHQYY